MKKIKTIKYSGLLFLSMLFLFGTTASASTNIADVCKTELKKNFQSFCQENENISSTLDIFKKERDPEKNGLQKISSPEGELESQKSSGLTADGEERLITGIEEWTEDKTIDGEAIIVMPGAELKIKEGVTVQFRNSAIGVSGKLIAQGTAENPITFKSLDAVDNQGFIIFSGLDSKETTGDEIIMSYVDISGGIKANYDNDYDDFGALTLGNAKLEIKESRIHGNGTAIMVVGDMPEEKTVNRTKFFDNRFDVAGYCFREGESVIPNFQYNWWGPYDESQWTHECYEGFGCFDFYSKVQGFVSIKPFFVSEDFHDPVIIVPGILGSENKDGIWQIDPVFHTYDNLYEEFIGNGFVPDEDVFTFPYEWRNSNVENAKLLRDKINEIKQATGYPKVDIVAHSMGGLLAREYVESDYYQNDVEQLIALGTPHRGAPEAYLKWEAGAFTFGASDMYLKHKFSQEAKENGFENIFKYIKERPILSVKELLPDYGYLYEVENNNELRSYPSNYPVNDFLENLNSFENVEKLENILFYKIIGNIENGKTTAEGFNVIDADMGEYWEHGYPLGFEIPIGDRGIIRNEGDGTVPLESAKSENIEAEKTIEINSSHLKLPTNAQKDVLEILTMRRPTEEVRHSFVRDILLVSVFSPIDIQIVAPDGKRIGKNFETGGEFGEIPGAFYSGFETENEFLTIPNPLEGEYKIITQGTGNGEYEVVASRITEDETTGEAKEISASVPGSARLGSVEERKIEVSEEAISVVEENVTVDSIIEKIEKYYSQGLIKKKSDRNFLIARLEFVKEAQEILERFRENRFVNKKVKERIISHFEDLINWNLDFLANYIKIRSAGKKNPIDGEAGKILIKDLNFIKY